MGIYSWSWTNNISFIDDGLIIVALILAIGLAVTAVFGVSSLQSRVPWMGLYPPSIHLDKTAR